MSSQNPIVAKVSIVTVCRNAIDTIQGTIDSVQAQTYANIEHVFIDGASTDGTANLISGQHPDVLISERDNGIYDAMQKSLSHLSGDIVYFLNSGDHFADSSVVADVVECFNSNQADAVFGNLLPVYADTGTSHDHPAFVAGKVLDLGYFGNRRLFYDESLHHQAVFYRSDLARDCGFKADAPAADGEYHLNMCAFVAKGSRAIYLPRTITRFALGGHSTANFDLEWQRFSNARDLLRAKFFPNGRTSVQCRYDEYLVGTPNLLSRLRLIIRLEPFRPIRWALARARGLLRR